MTAQSLRYVEKGVEPMSEASRNEAVIVAAVRTAIGKKKGSLSGTRADDLLAHALRSAVDRAKLDAKHIDDVITGCVTQIGEQGFNVSRTAALLAGFPVAVTGTTVNRQCGSTQQTRHFAAQTIMSVTDDAASAASGYDVCANQVG